MKGTGRRMTESTPEQTFSPRRSTEILSFLASTDVISYTVILTDVLSSIWAIWPEFWVFAIIPVVSYGNRCWLDANSLNKNLF